MLPLRPNETMVQRVEALEAEIDRLDKILSLSLHDGELRQRLVKIGAIIEAVDNRCMAADGPVSSTLKEMHQSEISEIYALATGGLPQLSQDGRAK